MSDKNYWKLIFSILVILFIYFLTQNTNTIGSLKQSSSKITLFADKSTQINIEKIILEQKYNVIPNRTLYLKENVRAPTKLSNCKAQLDDGSIIDLSSLDNVNDPK